MPARDWYRVLAIDLGFVDSDAFSILAFNRYDPALYVERCFKRSGTDVTTTCTTARELYDAVKPITTVVDTGGLGRKIAEELRDRHGVPFEAAAKTERHANLRLMAADLRSGRLKVVERQCPQLLEELRTLERDLKTGKERPGQENHCIDATMYGIREVKHYISLHWQPPPEPGSPEWYEEQEARHIRKLEKRARKRVARHGFPRGW